MQRVTDCGNISRSASFAPHSDPSVLECKIAISKSRYIASRSYDIAVKLAYEREIVDVREKSC